MVSYIPCPVKYILQLRSENYTMQHVCIQYLLSEDVLWNNQNKQQVIFVKGSGWDMSNLNELGLPGLYLKPLIETQNLKSLSDKKQRISKRTNHKC